MPAEADARLGLRLCLGWGVGTLTVGILFNTTSMLLMRYLTDFVGLAAGLAGLLISLSKIYDALTDPLMGWVSDRTRSRHGRRRPWLLLGAVLCGLALAALFAVPQGLQGPTLTAYVLLLLIGYATAYTVFAVPYMAMPTEMTRDYHERSRLMSFRVAFVGVAQLFAGYFAPNLVVWLGDGAAGHAGMGAVLGAALAAAGVACFFLTRGAPSAPVAQGRQPGLRAAFAGVAGNRPFLLLLTSKLLLLLSMASFGAGFTYFIVHVLGSGYATLGSFTVFSTAGMFASLPAWLWLTRRVDKRRTFMLAAVAYAALQASWFWAQAGEPTWAVLLRAAAMGVVGCGTLLAGQALLPDAIEYDRLRTGERREALFAGFYAMAEKFASAIGLAVTGAFLGAMGYVSSRGGEVQQPDSALLAISIAVSLVPAAMLLLSALALLRYDLGAGELARLRAATRDPGTC